jgi:hypothetical protein
MPTTTTVDKAEQVMDLAITHELRGEWQAASDQFRRAAGFFVEARQWADAEDALRRSRTCATVAAR